MPLPATRSSAFRATFVGCIRDLNPEMSSEAIANLVRSCDVDACPLHAYRPGAGTVQAAALSHGEEEATA